MCLYMNQSEFESHIYSGNRTESVDNNALDYFVKDVAEKRNFEVVELSAMEKDYPLLVNISTNVPDPRNSFDDDYLINDIKERITSGYSDIQKYQLRLDNGDVPDKILIMIHGSGYSASSEKSN